MRMIGLFILLIFLTGCSQNVGYGIGVTGLSASDNRMAATEIIADSETGIHGSITMGTDIRL
jgi:hypothetical protein